MLQRAESQRRSGGTEVAPLLLFEKVLQPALQLVSELEASEAELPEKQKTKVAALFGAKGRLLRTHPYEEWPFEDIDAEMLQSYEAALSFAPDSAEYFFGRGVARLRTPDASLPEVRADAERAQQLDAEHAGASGLLGSVLIRESRLLADWDQRHEKLAAAEAACSQAIRKDQEGGVERAHYLTTTRELR